MNNISLIDYFEPHLTKIPYTINETGISFLLPSLLPITRSGCLFVLKLEEGYYEFKFHVKLSNSISYLDSGVVLQIYSEFDNVNIKHEQITSEINTVSFINTSKKPIKFLFRFNLYPSQLFQLTNMTIETRPYPTNINIMDVVSPEHVTLVNRIEGLQHSYSINWNIPFLYQIFDIQKILKIQLQNPNFFMWWESISDKWNALYEMWKEMINIQNDNVLSSPQITIINPSENSGIYLSALKAGMITVKKLENKWVVEYDGIVYKPIKHHSWWHWTIKTTDNRIKVSFSKKDALSLSQTENIYVSFIGLNDMTDIKLWYMLGYHLSVQTPYCNMWAIGKNIQIEDRMDLLFLISIINKQFEIMGVHF